MDNIEKMIFQECIGSNMEFFGSVNTDNGIKIELVDYLDKTTDFESDVSCLWEEVRKNLDKNLGCALRYSKKSAMNSLTGETEEIYCCYIEIFYLKKE